MIYLEAKYKKEIINDQKFDYIGQMLWVLASDRRLKTDSPSYIDTFSEKSTQKDNRTGNEILGSIKNDIKSRLKNLQKKGDD